MLKGIIYFSLFLILAFIYIRYIELRSIFFPMRAMETTPELINLDFEDIYFKTEDGRLLNAWLIKNPKAKLTFIFCHGNAGNISHRLEKIAMLYQLGVNIFIFDYRGYGNSSGFPTEKGIYKDALAAYDFLLRREDIDKEKIACFGESLGGAVAIDLATKRKLTCLIIESTFTSGPDMGRLIYPFIPSFVYMSKFDSKKKVKNITIPKLFIHSINDEIVPFSFGEKLFNLAGTPKELLRITGGHNSGFIESRELILERLKSFLKGQNLI